MISSKTTCAVIDASRSKFCLALLVVSSSKFLLPSFFRLNETLDDFEPGVSSQGSLSEKENTMPMISPTNINVATATSTAKKPAKRRMSREDQDDDAVTEGPKRPRVCLGLSGPIDLDTTATSKKVRA